MDRIQSDTYIAAHPMRHRIMRFLADEGYPAEKVAKGLNLPRSLATFHLLTLKQHGLVKTNSEYTLGNPPEDPRAVLEYVLTDEGRELTKALDVVVA